MPSSKAGPGFFILICKRGGRLFANTVFLAEILLFLVFFSQSKHSNDTSIVNSWTKVIVGAKSGCVPWEVSSGVFKVVNERG
jgi:hypothetical protein